MTNMTIQDADGNMPHNILGMARKPIYMTDPLNKRPDDEPQDPAGTGEPTSTKGATQESWETRHNNLKGFYDRKIGSIEGQLTEILNENKTLKTQLAEKELNSKVDPQNVENYKEFKEKYPELARQMEIAASMAVSDQQKAINTRFQQLEEQQQAVRTEKGVLELKKYHPDFEEIKDDPRFIDWFERQLPEIQNLIRSTNPKVIAEGLTKYKYDTGIKQVTKQEGKKDLTRNVASNQRVQIGEGGKRIYSEAEIWKMPDAEFEKHSADIKLAQIEGRITRP